MRERPRIRQPCKRHAVEAKIKSEREREGEKGWESVNRARDRKIEG